MTLQALAEAARGRGGIAGFRERALEEAPNGLEALRRETSSEPAPHSAQTPPPAWAEKPTSGSLLAAGGAARSGAAGSRRATAA